MGSEESVARPYMADPYVSLVTPNSTKNDFFNDSYQFLSSKVNSIQQILQTGFHAVWSVDLPNSISPSPRKSHFTVHDKKENFVYIGYGLDNHDHEMNDLWKLDLETEVWARIDVKGLTARSGSMAALVEKKIYIFGGYIDNEYISDFHIIDLEKMNVIHPKLEKSPPPRTGHIMSVNGNKIMIWGGYNGDWLSDLWIFDIDKQKWREVQSDIKGRTSASCTELGDSLYIFGATRVDGLIRFDWNTEKIQIIQPTGALPSCETSSPAMTSCGKYVLVIGGKLEEKKYSLLYAYDTEKNFWFVFHIIPDGITTNISDGYTTKNGYFLVPRTSCSSLVYNKKTRSLKLFLGVPFVDPPSIFTLEMSEALSILNQSHDVLAMLYL